MMPRLTGTATEAAVGRHPLAAADVQGDGVSIAMGNASADVQRQTTFVTTSFGEKGFANAVDRFILSRTQWSNAM